MSSATRVTVQEPIWQKLDFQSNLKINASLLWAAVILALLGWVMVTSASMDWSERQYGDALHISIRHGVYLIMGGVAAWFVTKVPLEWLRSLSAVMVAIAMGSLVVVLIPGLGKEVNGSMRWVSLGIMNVQPSEFAKLATVIYMASYLDRRREEVQSSWTGFFKPLFVLAPIAILLLMEPDFGAVVVLMSATLALLFLGGVKAGQFLLTTFAVLGVAVLRALLQSLERRSHTRDCAEQQGEAAGQHGHEQQEEGRQTGSWRRRMLVGKLKTFLISMCFARPSMMGTVPLTRFVQCLEPGGNGFIILVSWVKIRAYPE